MGYDDIIKLRSMLLRSKEKESIFSRSKFIGEMQQLAMSVKPTDVELSFKNKPFYRVSFSDIIQPMGPSAELEKMRMTENPKIPQKIDYIVSDDLKAAEASFMLYGSGQDIYKITTILSSGVLGSEQKKKLVPTRYSITAVDDIIAKQLMKRIKTYKQINEYLVYESFFLDNGFVILLMPGGWEYENFEAWAPGTPWSMQMKEPTILQEYESFKGRTTYAESEGGGYYAARLAVAESLDQMRKQARAVVFREIYEGYVVPLGVWQVRENARNAMRQKPSKFSTMKEAMNFISSKLRLPIDNYIKISKILQQRRIDSFLNL